MATVSLVNLFNRSDSLHEDAGTYFHNSYEDSERVYSMFDSFCWANQLLRGEASDAARLFYRNEIPPLHRDLFRSIIVREQEYREGRKQTLVYGKESAIRYGDDYYYGVPASVITGAVALPDGVTDVDLCCELPVDPSIVLLKNEHFVIRSGHIVFTQDLFNLLPSEGDAPNRTLTLWLRSVHSDRNYLQNRLGVLTGTQGASTPEYKRFLNMIFDTVTGGSSGQRLTQLACQLFDVPCTKETEIVEQVGADESGRWLATDYAVYRAPLIANFLYTEGTLQPGTVLTDAIVPIYGSEFPEGEPLVIEPRFLNGSFKCGLIFPNEDLPITMDLQHRPVFQIFGRKDDIEKFWSNIYSSVTDSEFLTKAAVGGKINPAKFVYQNVFYPYVQFFRVYAEKVGKKPLPIINTKLFRALTPPDSLFSILLVCKPQPAELEFGLRESRLQQAVSPARIIVTLHEFSAQIESGVTGFIHINH
jgi:hypothetical protein